ncbi:hypothetical protein ARMGADRAFT_857966, partial [Armillaria gallica]
LIKPIPPTPYDGTPDGEKFHRFMMEFTQYCKEDEQVFLASHYLKGKAHSFFIQKVSRNHSQWKLLNFYQEMFNFCFPNNYRKKLHDQIKEAKQGNHTVSEFAYYLESKFNLVGTYNKHERVIKFWDGLQLEIWQELTLQKISAEVHRWKRI